MSATRLALIGLVATTAVACGRFALLSGGAGAGAGATGHAGAAGTSGVAGQTAAAGQMGHAGNLGQAGAAGQPGNAGQAGQAGHVGQAGAAGSTVDAGPPPPSTCNWAMDDENCGACGVACGPDATCQGGVCGPPATRVLTALQGCRSIDIAVSDGTLFWTDAAHGAVFSRPLAGGETTTLAAIQTRPTSIAVAAGDVFWLSGGNTIRRIAGGVPSDVVTAPTPIAGYAVSPDGADVYFSAGSTVSHVAAAGGAPVVVAEGRKGEVPGAVAFVAPQTVAFTTGTDGYVDLVQLVPGLVASCGGVDAFGEIPLLSCTVMTFQAEPNLFQGALFATQGAVLWLDGTYIEASHQGMAPPFSTWIDYVSTSDNVLTGVAATPSTVYFSDAGVIYKAPFGPHQIAVRLARRQNGAHSLALDATRVYWATADCTVESAEQ
jgi:hypothetical protein